MSPLKKYLLSLIVISFAFTVRAQQISAVSDCSSGNEPSSITYDQINTCYNPGIEAITIEFKDKKNNSGNFNVELYSVLGVAVYNKTFSKQSIIEIPVRGFKKGMYVIVVSDDKNSVKKRVLIN